MFSHISPSPSPRALPPGNACLLVSLQRRFSTGHKKKKGESAVSEIQLKLSSTPSTSSGKKKEKRRERGRERERERENEKPYVVQLASFLPNHTLRATVDCLSRDRVIFATGSASFVMERGLGEARIRGNPRGRGSLLSRGDLKIL